jgi:hypothetical protein
LRSWWLTSVNGLWKYLRCYKNCNVNSKLKRGIILSKFLIQLPPPVYRLGAWWWTSVQIFLATMSMNYKYIRGVTKILTNSKSKKGHNFVKMLDKVTTSCMHVGSLMVNKCAKFQSHMSINYKYIRCITKNFTNSN